MKPYSLYCTFIVQRNRNKCCCRPGYISARLNRMHPNHHQNLAQFISIVLRSFEKHMGFCGDHISFNILLHCELWSFTLTVDMRMNRNSLGVCWKFVFNNNRTLCVHMYCSDWCSGREAYFHWNLGLLLWMVWSSINLFVSHITSYLDFCNDITCWRNLWYWLVV